MARAALATRITMSHTAPHQYPQSPLPGTIHQSQRQAPQRQAPLSNPSPGTSKTPCIPSTVGACNKHTSSTLKRQDTTILYLTLPQSSQAHSQPYQYPLSRPHLSRPQVPSQIVPGSVTVDESVREEDGSDDEEKDENVEDNICQLLDQRTASQRRDKSCTPSH